MDERQLKKYLYDFYSLEAESKLLKTCIHTYNNTPMLPLYKEKLFQMQILSDAKAILNKTELFVIETHLIKHCTWSETAKLFSIEYGKEMERSERTLKRLQNKALKKMLKLIDELPVQNHFTDRPY